MKISDEIRKWCAAHDGTITYKGDFEKLCALADRIDDEMAELPRDIVRCKDCKWACEPDDDGGYDVHFLACTWWMAVSRSSVDLFVEEDDFCSHGEKMEATQ